MKFIRIFACVMVPLVAACAALATKYQPRAGAGGYSDTKLNADTYEVRYETNGFSNHQATSVFLLRRAAELTLEQGRRYFLLSNRDTFQRGEDQAMSATVRFVDEATPDAADAVEVIRDTDAVAEGRISSEARAQLLKFSAGSR